MDVSVGKLYLYISIYSIIIFQNMSK
jgi:hypothetical protein